MPEKRLEKTRKAYTYKDWATRAEAKVDTVWRALHDNAAEQLERRACGATRFTEGTPIPNARVCAPDAHLGSEAE
jgi:hypothetical protein